MNGNIGLVKKISERFSEEEIRTLCFEMGVEYDDLRGEGRAAKARELVKWCDYRNRIDDLSLKCFTARPDVDWVDEIAHASPLSIQKALPGMGASASSKLVGMQLAQITAAVDYLTRRIDHADVDRARVKIMVGGSLALAAYQALSNILK